MWVYQEAIVLEALWTRAGLRFFFNGFCEHIARESLPSSERHSEHHRGSFKLEMGHLAEQVGITHPSACAYVLSAMPWTTCGDVAGELPLQTSFCMPPIQLLGLSKENLRKLLSPVWRWEKVTVNVT